MEIEQLGEFYLLYETSSFSEAAEQLFIAQSTLSRHLKSLEDELGTPLFTRSKRKVEINEYGKILLPYARQIVRLHSEMTNAISQRLNSEKRLLTVGTISAIPQYGISDLLAEFSQVHPEITLEILEDESDVLEHMVLSGRIDFAFTNSCGEIRSGLAAVPFVHDTLAIMVAQSHPLSGKSRVQLDRLCDESFLMLPDNTFLMKLCVDICNNAGFTPRISFHSVRGDNIADMVSQSFGISLVPRQAAEYNLPDNVALLEIVPPVNIYVNVVYREAAALSCASQAFLEFLQAHGQLPGE